MPKPYRLGGAQPTSKRFSGKSWGRGSAFFVTLQRRRTHVWEGCPRPSASVLGGGGRLRRTPGFFCSVHALNTFQQCVVSVFERLGNYAPREVAVLQLDLREHCSGKSCCGPDQFLFHVRPSREWLCRNSHSAPGGGGHPFASGPLPRRRASPYSSASSSLRLASHSSSRASSSTTTTART